MDPGDGFRKSGKRGPHRASVGDAAETTGLADQAGASVPGTEAPPSPWLICASSSPLHKPFCFLASQSAVYRDNQQRHTWSLDVSDAEDTAVWDGTPGSEPLAKEQRKQVRPKCPGQRKTPVLKSPQSQGPVEPSTLHHKHPFARTFSLSLFIF